MGHEGGFGIVKKVFPYGDDIPVARKYLKGKGDDILDELQAEVRALSRVSDSRIVRILSYGIASEGVPDDKAYSGRPYVDMEWLDGKTLEDCIREDRELGIRDRLKYLDEVLRAVQSLHSEGIMHRDLKLDNVFVDHDGKLKLIDLGFAVSLDNVYQSVALGQANRDTLPPESEGTIIDSLEGEMFTVGLLALDILNGYGWGSRKSVVEKGGQGVNWNVTVPVRVRKAIMGALEVEPSKRTSSPRELRVMLTENVPAINWRSCNEGLVGVIPKNIKADRDFPHSLDTGEFISYSVRVMRDADGVEFSLKKSINSRKARKQGRSVRVDAGQQELRFYRKVLESCPAKLEELFR